MKESAMNCGADCNNCPLKDTEDIVYPEANRAAQIAIVADHPSEFEVRYTRPLVGPTTKIFSDALRESPMTRGQFHITMAVLCRPPDNDMKKLLGKIRKANRKIKSMNRKLAKEGQETYALIKTPQECCAPRLENELKDFDKFLTLGSYATKAVLHKKASVMDLRGSPTSLRRWDRDIKVVPTFHPAMVTKSLRWSVPFKNDILKAIKWFSRGLDWQPPTIIYHPSASELREFFNQPDVSYWAYDVETDGIECLTASLRCIAIGTAKYIALVGLLGIDGKTKFYATQEEEDEVVQVLKEFMLDPTKLKMGWNSGYYDRLVMENHFGLTPQPHIDGMLFHRLVESELPHSLGFAGSMYTEAPSWKTDRNGKKKAYGSETDFELHEYCGYDVAVTAEVLTPLIRKVKERYQEECLKCDHQLQEICAEMHKVGMRVSQSVRLDFEKKYLKEVYERRERIRDLADVVGLNPASTTQLRSLLYEDWNLLPHLAHKMKAKDYMTDSGEPSTGDDVMRALLTIPILTDQQRAVLENIRLFRRSQKMLGTYVTKLRYSNEDINPWEGYDEEDDWVTKEMREKYGLKKKGIVDPETHRMYPGYNVHVTVSGRLSSSSPINAQNFPNHLRSMVVASPGNVLVGADMDQLELRIAASRWQSEKYLEAFENGLDPHSSVTAHAVFGERFEKMAIECGVGGYPWKTGTKFKGDAKKLRNLSKAIQYASQYWASVETVHRLITQTEVDNGDGTTSLPYLSLSMREVRLMHKKWCEGAKFDKGWERELNSYRRNGFLSEPVMQRRRDFLDGENLNEIVNFPIQAAASSLMNRALIQLREAIPPHKWGFGTGIINQCHDSIVVECPEYAAKEVAGLLEECLNQTHPSLPRVLFTAEAGMSNSWNDVG